MTEEGMKQIERDQSQRHQREIERIMSMTHQNNKTDIRSTDSHGVGLSMPVSIKTRAHSYWIAAAFFTAGFQTDFVSAKCSLMDLMIGDFRKDSLNDYIYLSLV
jgi:hypothetical protein